MSIKQILKSKILLYLAYLLAAINVVGYINMGSFECLAVFALAYYILTLLNIKNTTLEIFGALLVSNIIFGCGRMSEGFKEGAKGKKNKIEEVLDIAKGAAKGAAEGAAEDATNEEE